MVALILWGAYSIVSIVSNAWKGTAKITQSSLAMNQTEYNLLQSAVSLVLNDIGEYNSIGSALTALYAELPVSIRDRVIEQLGTVKNVADLPDSVQSLLNRVIITGGSAPAVETVPKTPEPIQTRTMRRR